MSEIIPHEDNIDKLTNAIKVINEQLTRLTGSGDTKMSKENKEFIAVFRER